MGANLAFVQRLLQFFAQGVPVGPRAGHVGGKGTNRPRTVAKRLIRSNLCCVQQRAALLHLKLVAFGPTGLRQRGGVGEYAVGGQQGAGFLGALGAWLDRVPLVWLVVLTGWLALAPFFPEPHLWEKLKMLAAGARWAITGDAGVREVGGDLVVRRIGSGDVSHRDVRGPVDLPSDD